MNLIKIRLIPVIIILLFLSTNAMARFYTDAGIMYAHTWSNADDSSDTFENDTYGAVIDLGLYIQRDISISFGGFFLTGEMEDIPMPTPMPANSYHESSLEHFGFKGGVVYTPQISFLMNFRIFLSIHVEAGYDFGKMSFKIIDKTTKTVYADESMEDDGPIYMVSSSIRYQMFQNWALILKFGWSTIQFKGEFGERSTNNEFIASFGVRYSIFKNKKLYDQY